MTAAELKSLYPMYKSIPDDELIAKVEAKHGPDWQSKFQEGFESAGSENIQQGVDIAKQKVRRAFETSPMNPSNVKAGYAAILNSQNPLATYRNGIKDMLGQYANPIDELIQKILKKGGK